eukprot:CAMPEP_0180308204 /NCGR_PEP_ID=MMETSP0988-20121125/28366_1 /TAXON_ID=697907 /ORGANISM="non described non described, Strain CCMP2293" /LENGTH=98 /DNA_ID=CAMNT_0022291751 /DNA_START=281 /DNA_END=574 /DNA_ORIENTATION=+
MRAQPAREISRPPVLPPTRTAPAAAASRPSSWHGSILPFLTYQDLVRAAKRGEGDNLRANLVAKVDEPALLQVRVQLHLVDRGAVARVGEDVAQLGHV